MKNERKKVFTVQTGIGCNNNCIFCMETQKRPKIKHTLQDFKKASKTYDIIDFSLGEPTLNPKLFEMIAMAKKVGFKNIEITTNGRMLSLPNYAKKLVNAGLTKFKISIHGADAFTHDSLTRTPGSFKQVLSGLIIVKKIREIKNIGLDTQTTITKQNYKNIPEMLQLFSKLNVDQIVFNLFDPIGQAEKKAKILLPKYTDVEKYFNKGIQNSKNLPNCIISIPLCILRNSLKKYAGNYELIILNQKEIPNKEEIRRGKIFLKRCEKCIAKEECDGIWEKYLSIYGDEEIMPITDSSLLNERKLYRNQKV